METWGERMPQGMLLKSDGFASNLSAPQEGYSLKDFCELRGIPYDDMRVPVSLETFVEYGLWFQKQWVPKVDPRRVARINRGNETFVVETDDGEKFAAKRVVLATGLGNLAWIPPQFAGLPSGLVTHSSMHRQPSDFQEKEVTVIGGGASAIDLAALLQEQGAKVCIVARRPEIEFHNPPALTARTFREKLRNPSSGLGPGWKSRIYTDAPFLFRLLPVELRQKIVREHLGPAAGWPMRERVGKVPMFLGTRNMTANMVDGKVQLLFLDKNCQRVEHLTDHVIAATGYRASVRRLNFLSESIQSELRTVSDTPLLTSRFESSVPGLYFVGLFSANSFGPMMKFAFGADYTSRLLARHLQSRAHKRSSRTVAYRTEAVS